MRYIFNIVVVVMLFSSTIQYGQEVFDSSIVRYQKTIHFESNQYELIDGHKKQIDSLLNKISQSTNLQLFIDAHTDDLGSEAFNLELSNRRKKSVHDYLLHNGISESMITSRSHGEKSLVINKKDVQSRQRNRRVDIQAFTTEKLRRIRGQIVDELTNVGIKGTVGLQSLNYSSSVVTNEEGYYEIAAPLGVISMIEYHSKNYFYERKEIHISNNIHKINVPLRRATIGSKLTLRNINFEDNKNVLLPSSKPHLDRLIKFMTINKNTCIELAGHTNSYGYKFLTKDDLSVARAAIIFEKLKESGVEKYRMVAKGYGDLFKLFPEPKSHFEMMENKRVELIIVDCESIKKIENDTMINPSAYSNLRKFVLNRKFNSESYQSDLKFFYPRRQQEIMLKVRNLKEQNEDPSDYTYAALLEAGQELKYKDNPIATKLRAIYVSDQQLRKQTGKIEEKHGLESDELKSHWKKIRKTDSINLVEVKKILDERGWLDSKEVSYEGNAALFLVIQHSDLNTQLSCLPMLRAAVKKGSANSKDLALLEDRIAISQGGKQIYGSQIHRDSETGTHYVAPLANPKNVNIRRKRVGLIPMETYVQRWNIDWEAELLRLIKED